MASSTEDLAFSFFENDKLMISQGGYFPPFPCASAEKSCETEKVN